MGLIFIIIFIIIIFIFSKVFEYSSVTSVIMGAEGVTLSTDFTKQKCVEIIGHYRMVSRETWLMFQCVPHMRIPAVRATLVGKCSLQVTIETAAACPLEIASTCGDSGSPLTCGYNNAPCTWCASKSMCLPNSLSCP